ncbi:hypothetical protein QFZ81_001678 [Paenibacillus sp. V4I9]|nr:hypothetical protein [Paenibacillus sp. V4I9]
MLQEYIILKMNGETKTWTQAESFLERQGDGAKVLLKVLYPPESHLRLCPLRIICI